MFEGPGYFRSRPVVVQAVQFDGGNHADCIQFCATATGSAAREPTPDEGPQNTLMLTTPDGDVRVDAKEWIIKAHAFTRVRADDFEQQFGPAANTIEDRLRMFIAEPLALDVITRVAHDGGDPETAARLAAERCRDQVKQVIGW